MEAVATQINPSAGIDTYSKLLGLQQSQLQLQGAQQNLQTNQYLQAQAQAKAQQDQQAAAEMRAGAQLMADPLGNGLVDKDGNPTVDAYQKIKRIMPITGDAQYEKMMSAAKGRVEYADAYSNLTQKQRGDVNSALAAVAADPNSKASDVLSRLQLVKQDYAGTGAEASIDRIIKNTSDGIGAIRKEVGDGPNGSIHPKLQQFLLGLSRGSLGNQGITGSGGIAAGSNVVVDQGGTVQPGVQNSPLSGGGLTLAGQPIVKTLAPNQTPEYAGRVAQASASGTGTASGDIDRKNQISAAVAPSNNAISTIAEMRSLTRQISQGSFSQQILKASQAAGDSSPEITARNLLKKDMANLKTSVGSAATTDAQRSTIDQSFPDLENPDVPTVTRALDRIEGTMRQNLVRSRSAQDYLKKHPDAGGLQQADDKLMSDADPLMHTYNALKSPQERAEFLKRHFDSPEQAKDFINRKRAHDHVGGLNE